MPPKPPEITRVTHARLVRVGAGPGLWTARLVVRWSAGRDPWAVDLTFARRFGDRLTWSVGRDLLREGLASRERRAGGEGGSIHIGPSRQSSGVSMMLHSDCGSLLVYASREPFEEVLAFSYGTVAEGEELARVDFDAALASIVAAEGGGG